MALSDPQALSPDSATDVDTNTVSFVRRFGDESRSKFSVAGLTPPAEELLTVSHDEGKSGEQRSMARIDKTVVDAFGVPATASFYGVWVRPANTALTDAIMLGITNKLIDFMIEGGSNANVTKILNKEV